MPRLLVTISIALLSFVAAAAESTLRPATHEDLWLMNRVGTPVVSPDGRYAVVDITEPSYEEDGSVSDLWLIQVDGDVAPRHLTSTPEPEAGVEWSPDGTKIAFHTMRGDDEFNQVYVLTMDGPGEAVQVTSISTGASNPRWSPDGTRIAFESLVYPGTADDAENVAERKVRDELKYNVSVYETFPVRQWDRWRDDMQTRLFVQDARTGTVATDLLAGSDLVAAAGQSRQRQAVETGTGGRVGRHRQRRKRGRRRSQARTDRKIGFRADLRAAPVRPGDQVQAPADPRQHGGRGVTVDVQGIRCLFAKLDRRPGPQAVQRNRQRTDGRQVALDIAFAPVLDEGDVRLCLRCCLHERASLGPVVAPGAGL